VDTSRDHCRYLEANANNNLTFREMHEPIYGFYRQGLAPEPYKLENSEILTLQLSQPICLRGVSVSGTCHRVCAFQGRHLENISPCNNSSLHVNGKSMPCPSLLVTFGCSILRQGAQKLLLGLLGNGQEQYTSRSRDS
jgi:hypothetical protein